MGVQEREKRSLSCGTFYSTCLIQVLLVELAQNKISPTRGIYSWILSQNKRDSFLKNIEGGVIRSKNGTKEEKKKKDKEEKDIR